jgi:ribosome-associated protein
MHPAGQDRQQVSQGLAPRRGRAYREIFQLVREQMQHDATNTPEDEDQDE